MTSAPVMTVREVADTLRVSQRHVYRLVEHGRLPALRVGSGPRAPLRVTRHDLADFLADSGAAHA